MPWCFGLKDYVEIVLWQKGRGTRLKGIVKIRCLGYFWLKLSITRLIISQDDNQIKTREGSSWKENIRKISVWFDTLSSFCQDLGLTMPIKVSLLKLRGSAGPMKSQDDYLIKPRANPRV